MTAKAATFSVRLPDNLKTAVAKLAATGKRSRAFIVKEAVAAYVDERRAWLDAIDEALTEADRGVFVSGEAVAAWLKTWGDKVQRPAPKADIFPEQAP